MCRWVDSTSFILCDAAAVGSDDFGTEEEMAAGPGDLLVGVCLRAAGLN